MKTKLIALLALLAATSGSAQGTFQYDQLTLASPIPPNFVFDIQPSQPIGQSFTPTLPLVDFVQFALFDGHPNNGLGATLYVNLRSNSITGPIVSSSNPVFMPETPSGGGPTHFFFSGPVAVVPGTTYFFEIVVQSGDTWRVNTLPDIYSGGTMFVQGVAQPLQDLWFREGVIVPEPSAAAIFSLTGAAFLFLRRKKDLLTPGDRRRRFRSR
jgi:hypothetical protein